MLYPEGFVNDDFKLNPDFAFNPSVAQLLSSTLRAPLRELFNRPSKLIRAEMVMAGYALSGEGEERRPTSARDVRRLRTLADALEALHVGSLIVDDIQDGSAERRGSPALHRLHGVPLALNAGNALYFWPLEWIRDLDLPEGLELRLYRMVHAALFRAHLGQALDLGAPIDQIEQGSVAEICAAAVELKTGELMALALGVGAALAGGGPRRLTALMDFGRRFGVALQMHNDLENLSAPIAASKRLEDLRLRRPTWIWSQAAQVSTPEEYADFLAAVRALPSEAPLDEWFVRLGFRDRLRAAARAHLDESLQALHAELGDVQGFSGALTALNRAASQISVACHTF